MPVDDYIYGMVISVQKVIGQGYCWATNNMNNKLLLFCFTISVNQIFINASSHLGRTEIPFQNAA